MCTMKMLYVHTLAHKDMSKWETLVKAYVSQVKIYISNLCNLLMLNISLKYRHLDNQEDIYQNVDALIIKTLVKMWTY